MVDPLESVVVRTVVELEERGSVAGDYEVQVVMIGDP